MYILPRSAAAAAAALSYHNTRRTHAIPNPVE
jgi:hypothetical protein